MSYDAAGHVAGVKDPLGKVTNFTYDGQGSLTSIVDALGRTTSMTRDLAGRVTLNTDATFKNTAFAYDTLENLTRVTDHAGGVTTYDYVPGMAGKLLRKVVDAERQAAGVGTVFGYDDLGRLKSVTNAAGQTKTFTYDIRGRLKTITDAKNQVITFGYDELDRLKTKTLPEGTVSYDYNAAGNLTKVTNYDGGVVEMRYDDLDRVDQVVQTHPGGYSATIGYGYDANGNRETMTTPWGTFSYGYDALNRLTSITNPDGRTITFGYNALGQRTRMSYPNGTETTYAYDPAGRLTQILHRKTIDNTALAWADYAYDDAGNRTSMTDHAGTHSYGYDDLHRLISAEHPSGSNVPTKSEVFDYDRAGNRLFDANITAYQYDAANRLLSNSSFTYSYDNNGNQTGKTLVATGQTTAYAYNAENQLVQADMPDGTRQTNAYDGLGRRIEKSTGPVGNMTPVRYVYDNEDILAMLDGNNNLIALFTHGPGIDEPNIMKEAGGPEYFFHADALGSVAALTDEQGSVVERVEYEAYGRPRFVDLRGGTPVVGDRSFTASQVAFADGEYDPEIKQIRFGVRFYDPALGRFSSEDPLPATNLYVYAIGNPLLYTDSNGSAIQLPDYISINVGINLLGGVGGIPLQATVDRFGNFYVTPPGTGVSGGLSPSPVSLSLVGGYLDSNSVVCPNYRPTEEELLEFLLGGIVTGGGGFLIGRNKAWVPGVGTATEYGIFSPQIGATIEINIQPTKVPLSWPKQIRRFF